MPAGKCCGGKYWLSFFGNTHTEHVCEKYVDKVQSPSNVEHCRARVKYGTLED
jgi:hypothetical protein